MKSRAIVCAIAAAALSLGSLSASAQNWGERQRSNANNPVPADSRGERRDFERRDVQRRDFERRDVQRRDLDRRDYERRADRDYGNNRYYYGARGPEFRRGGHIPGEYRNRQYYVSDWRGHHLSAPPRGYQWVQVGGDYVLIALATGLIANLILNQ
jgi:Ni/Co efflux regulator RcnB